MKTFDDILQYHYIHDKGLNNPEYVKNAAFEFATQVAEAVRQECAKKAVSGRAGNRNTHFGIQAINISQFIK